MSDLPDDWSLAELRDTAVAGRESFIDGDWIEAPYITDQGTRLIQTGNIGRAMFVDKAESRKFISVATFRQLRCKSVRAGDILICRLADPIGRACQVPSYLDRSVTSVDVTILRIDLKAFEPRFVLQWLNSDFNLKNAADRAGGSTRSRISRTNLGHLPIPRPPTPQQRLIAQILDSLDTQIRRTEEIIAKLDQIKQGFLTDLLCRGIDENGELRPSPEEAPELYKDSPLGWIPREWEVEPLGRAASKIQDGTHFSPQGGGHDYLYITSKNVRFGFLDLTEVEMISEADHKKIYSRCDVKEGDLLLTKDGANTGNAAVNTLRQEISLLSSIAFIRINRSTDSVRFHLHYLLSPMGQQRMKDMMSGNAITRLTLEKIRAFTVLRPTLGEQQRVSTVLDSIDQRAAAELRQASHLRKTKQGLMDDLLTGRVRVTPLLEEAEQATA